MLKWSWSHTEVIQDITQYINITQYNECHQYCLILHLQYSSILPNVLHFQYYPILHQRDSDSIFHNTTNMFQSYIFNITKYYEPSKTHIWNQYESIFLNITSHFQYASVLPEQLADVWPPPEDSSRSQQAPWHLPAVCVWGGGIIVFVSLVSCLLASYCQYCSWDVTGPDLEGRDRVQGTRDWHLE